MNDTHYSDNKEFREISEKINAGIRLTPEDGLALFRFPLGFLSALAGCVSERISGKTVYYIRNFHIEPTNICSYHCRFCSYSQKSHENGGWELTLDNIAKAVKESDPRAAEIHITGGAHPRWDLNYYGQIVETVKKIRPEIHIKAFSAVEIHHLSEKIGESYSVILKYLINKGLGSIPGGGAEIFDSEIRKQICREKVDADGWLKIHETAHGLGLPTNATMLYGHIESYAHRIHHITKLRDLQDKTGGFRSFIPLKFRNQNNNMSDLPELSLVEDLRNYAVSRIYLDNFLSIKAYWPMMGKRDSQISLFFGVNDLDGTIQDTTQIYSLAGATEKASMTVEEMIQLINEAGKIAVERDAYYKPII